MRCGAYGHLALALNYGGQMDSYALLGNLTAVFVLIAQIVVLFLQVSMLRRHRQKCFLLLALGQLLLIAYTTTSLLLEFLVSDAHLHLLVFQASCAAVIVGLVFGLWGVVVLFRSYTLLLGARDV